MLMFITAMKTLSKDSSDLHDVELERSEIWNTVFVGGCVHSGHPVVKNTVSLWLSCLC